MNRLLILSLLVGVALSDMYLQFPCASNNRYNERNRDRNNGNRLFDSQNNDRGGCNVNKFTLCAGEKVSVQWTHQHSSGNYQMQDSEIIIQMACGDRMRDGTVTTTIPDKPTDCYLFDCDTDVKFGRHESYMDYQMCKASSRNKGLFTANQNLRGNAARYTRQNPQGTRRGYECPEERDYFPYWRPSIWRDVAFLVTNFGRCDDYITQSQNEQPRSYCDFHPVYWKYYLEGRGEKVGNKYLPLNETECEMLSENYTNPENNETIMTTMWVTQEAWNIPAADCLATQISRPNYHGLVASGDNIEQMKYDWTVPSDPRTFNKCCVLRIRYNITTADYYAWDSAETLTPGVDANQNSNTTRKPDPNKDPAWIPMWTKFGLTYQDIAASFDRDRDGNPQQNSRGYVFINNPRIDPYDITFDTNQNGVTARVQFQLAINTNQFGRTFQDRTHCFVIKKCTEDFENNPIPNDADILLLGIQGKRGNIVQVYPATEYFYKPEVLRVQPGQYIHACFTGSNTNPNNNDGQGLQGTDRNNLCPINIEQFDRTEYADVDGYSTDKEVNQMPNDLGTNFASYVDTDGTIMNETNSDGYYIPANGIFDSTNRGLVRNPALPQKWQNAMCTLQFTDEKDGYLAFGSVQEFDDAGTTICPPPVKVNPNVDASKPIKINYIGTRNNNFSNRSQKGAMSISEQSATLAVVSSYGGIIRDGNAMVIIPGGATDVSALAISLTSNENEGWAMIDFSEEELNDGYKITLLIPYTPKALHIPVVYRLNDNGGWSEQGEADKQYKNNRYMAEIATRRAGTYKVENEIDGLAVASVVIGTLLFAGAIGFACFKKCKN